MAELGIHVELGEDGAWAVRLMIEGAAQELAPLSEAVALVGAACAAVQCSACSAVLCAAEASHAGASGAVPTCVPPGAVKLVGGPHLPAPFVALLSLPPEGTPGAPSPPTRPCICPNLCLPARRRPSRPAPWPCPHRLPLLPPPPPAHTAPLQHIADCLRMKTALDAGAPPLEQLALSRPLEAFSDVRHARPVLDQWGIVGAHGRCETCPHSACRPRT